MKSNELKIAEPCKVDWKKMTPAEGGRFCGDCKKVVKNLSSMTEREARKVLRTASEGSLCVRFIYDAQGKVFFGADAPKADPLLPAAMLSRAKRFAVAAGLAAATQACSALESTPLGETSQQQRSEDPSHPDDPAYNESMGGVSYDPSDDRPVAEDAGPAATDAGADATPDPDAAPAPPAADAGTPVY